MPCSSTANIANNLAQIHHNISEYCNKYQRQPESVCLLAVSKTKSATDIHQAFNAGQTHFGENYLQEALDKIQTLSELDIQWHFIGSIQSNKTRQLAENFLWVHSVERLKIAQRLSQQRPDTLPPLNICLQLNISDEVSKSGLSVHEVEPLVNEIFSLPNLKLRGLMAIPAKAETLEAQRLIFAQVKALLTTLQIKHPQLDTLSMGMSGDMEAAIAEGTTIVRIGTAIFGAR